MATKLPLLPATAAAWLSLISERWGKLRGLGIGGALALASAAVAVATNFYSWPSWPLKAIASATGAWFLITLPISMYQVWRDERLAKNSMLSSLEAERDAKLPDLVGNIRLLAKASNKSHPEYNLFLIQMEVRNRGFQSVARDYMPVVTLEGRETYGVVMETLDEVTLTSRDGSKRRAREADAIYNATRSPIPAGDVRDGHLMVAFKATLGDFAKELIRVRFRDYLGNVVETGPNLDVVAIERMPNPRNLPFERNPD
jgi:hypothetical protein